MNEREARIIEKIRAMKNPEKALDIIINITLEFIEEKKKLRKKCEND